MDSDNLDAIARGVKRFVDVLPTGGGKTVLFTHTARRSAVHGRRVCIVVHRRELLKQTIRKLNYEHGVICSGFTPMRHRLIQIASIDTLRNRTDEYWFDDVIWDECHHIMAAGWRRVMNAYPDAIHMGVTATPVRLDGRGLGDEFDELIMGPTPRELIASGYLAPVEVYRPKTLVDTSQLGTRAGDFKAEDLAFAADKPTITGDAIQMYRKYADHKPAIAFCVSVAHAEHVAESFRRAGYRASRVDGGTPEHDRDRMIQDLGSGGLDVLTSCELISEGVDVPVVECGIMLRPTQSLTLALQQPGRIMRPSPGKRAAIILDHAGNCIDINGCVNHGLPDQDREWSLQGVTKRKGGKRLIPEINSVLRSCPKCFAVHEPAPKCPYCGYVYPSQGREIDHRQGELVRVESAPVDPVKTAAQREQGMAQSKEALRKLAVARGHKESWADHVFAARLRKAGILVDAWYQGASLYADSKAATKAVMEAGGELVGVVGGWVIANNEGARLLVTARGDFEWVAPKNKEVAI